MMSEYALEQMEYEKDCLDARIEYSVDKIEMEHRQERLGELMFLLHCIDVQHLTHKLQYIYNDVENFGSESPYYDEYTAFDLDHDFVALELSDLFCDKQ